MKQIIQNLKNGIIELVDIPTPVVQDGHLLIQTKASVISAGTERMLVDFGKANVFNKAMQQPDKLRQVVDKIKADGLFPTINAVKAKLDQPIPLGYSNAGVVLAVGKGVDGFSVGDRVASNGRHAEVVSVPKNLCARIPNNVNDEEAAFTAIGSVALQGIRLAQPTLGEVFAVIGLGLIGLLTVQLLKAHGCIVIGFDMDQERLDKAKQSGAYVVNLLKNEDPISAVAHLTGGRGVDGVLITASTESSKPVHQAALMCRKRGRIVLIGVTGLELSRADFYEKELTFQVSCSYGPGRYDPEYEEKGHDYPFGFVRWTEQRNFEAFLGMLSEGKVKTELLVTHRFTIDEAVDAYRTLSEEKKALGIILQYPDSGAVQINKKTFDLTPSNFRLLTKEAGVGVIGAGNFTNQVLLPAIKKTSVRLVSLASSGGLTGYYAGKRFGFEETTTEVQSILENKWIHAVFITTRHNTHMHYVKAALEAGKHVFVEKPLCITKEELEELKCFMKDRKEILMVGFNRRFSPLTNKMKDLLRDISEPKTFIMMVNAGYIPKSHWTQDPKVGGGRIIGEACHFIDLLRCLAGYQVLNVNVTKSGNVPGVRAKEDEVTITLTFADGSIGTVHYLASGHKSYPKEKLEVFAGGRVLLLENFRVLTGYGWSGFKKMKLIRQDKGHVGGVQAFVSAIKNTGVSPIPLEEIFEVTELTLKAAGKY